MSFHGTPSPRRSSTPGPRPRNRSASAGVTKGVKFTNSSKVTLYALRHTSIVRQLLANVPVRVVAALHDTSTTMIERNYSRYIADHADELARATLPQPVEVVPLDDRRLAASKNL